MQHEGSEQAMSEKQICPRRVGVGAGSYNLPETDEWQTREGKGDFLFCSYCGGLKPDEALLAIRSGKVRVIRTDKNYKIYLDGGGLYHQKVYLQHFTREQIAELNELLGLRPPKPVRPPDRPVCRFCGTTECVTRNPCPAALQMGIDRHGAICQEAARRLVRHCIDNHVMPRPAIAQAMGIPESHLPLDQVAFEAKYGDGE